MDEMQQMWERRYAAGEQSPDGVAPHPEVVALLERLEQEPRAGTRTALDLGSGPGRHVLALARAGYDATGVDFSPTAVRVLEDALRRHGLPGRGVVGDLRTWSPQEARRQGRADVPQEFDLVLAAYFQHSLELLRNATGWLAPGGTLLWITHAPDSVDGPPAGVPRPGPAETLKALEGTGLEVRRAEEVRTSGTALDVVLEAVRPR